MAPDEWHQFMPLPMRLPRSRESDRHFEKRSKFELPDTKTLVRFLTEKLRELEG
jgi:hypothetical protein